MSNHLSTVQTIYGHFQRGEVPQILERLADDVQWEHDSVDHGVPWLAAGRGRAHVGQFFATLAAGLEITAFEPRSFLVNEAQVAVVIWFEARSKRNDAVIRDLETHLWTFDEAGAVARFRHICDTAQHRAAVG